MKGRWLEIELGGKKADVYEPPAPARFGVLFLHGIGLETLRERPAFTGLFDQHGLACISPHGGPFWWTDRPFPDFDPTLTSEQHLLRHVVPGFERWGIRPRAIGLLGISMGGQGALRLAFRHPTLFPAVAAISPAIEYHELYGQGSALDEMYDSKEQCRQDTAPMHVHPSQYPPHLFYCIDPDDGPWVRGCDRLHEKLNALGIEHEVDMETRHGGHSWAYFDHMAGPAVRFLVAGLETEGRRLL